MSGFDREKHLKPLLAGGFIVLLLCGFWIYSSYQQSLEKIERKTSAAHSELRLLQESLQKYRVLNAKFKKSGQQGAVANKQNLIATVENATQKVGARSQLLYVRPQPDKAREDLVEEGVEIRLEKLQLQQLVELLYQFETAQQMLKISQLRVRPRFDDPAQLDTVMTLSRFREQR